MMVTFLNNLPSFDKDNFSNFQPDLNQYAQQTKKQHSYVIGTTIERGGDDCSSSSPLSDACDMRDHAQLIVNQRCNLIIQYLDKQSRDDYDDEDDEDTEDENHDELCGHSHMFNLAANSAAEKNRKKRDIREVLDTNPESFGGSSSKTSHDGQIDSTSSSSSSKYSKKRRTSIQNYESNAAQSSSTASTSSGAAGNNNESIEPIEVDNPNENVDF